jgi:hypothetical protein
MLLFSLWAIPASAQDGSHIGLGVSISDDFTGDLVSIGSGNTPPSAVAPTIFMPMTPSPHLRVEPEIGFQWASTTNANGSTQSNTVVHFGSGIFGLATKDRFTAYYGARIAYLHFDQFSGSGQNGFSFPDANGYFIAPSIGGEYFIADRVSVGGEVQVRYTHETFHDTTGARAITASTANTHGAVTLRVWFR